MTESTRNRIRRHRSAHRRRSQTRMILWVAVVAVAIVGGLILVSVLSRPAEVDVEQSLARYEGLDQTEDQTAATGFALGLPEAPVTIVEYADFSCGHCADLSEIIHRIVDDYVRQGQARIVFKPVAILSPQYSTSAAKAAICAGQQGRFWEMQDQIWGIYHSSTPSGYTPRNLDQIAQSLALDMAQFSTCSRSPDTQSSIDLAGNELLQVAQAVGLTQVGTPTLVVNGAYVPYTGADGFYGTLANIIQESSR